MIRLLIADDHAIFREGLKHILEEHPDIIVADEAGNSIRFGKVNMILFCWISECLVCLRSKF
jgi:DNA-binding NarL/FixJ family response regulator